MGETVIQQKKKGRSRNLVLHLHPPKVNKESIRFTLTFGLGGLAAVLFILQDFTGVLLRFGYVASPAEAYDSSLSLQNNILFGQLTRNIHHWSGIFFVIIAFLHLLRTFYTGAFYYERRWNWIIGLALMVVVILSNFTGYLLPWDQLAYWAVTVSTSLLRYVPLVGDSLTEFVRGGQEVGSATLLIFYNFHSAILPLTLVLLMVFHFWRVRKNKGVVVAENSSKEMVPSDPDLISKELVTTLVLIAFILLMSIFFNAPLQERADPAFSPNPAKAPWYFMGIQELLLHFHPLVASFIIPLIFLIALIWLPFLKYGKQHRCIWFFTPKGKKLTVVAVIISLLFTLSAILISEYLIDFESWLGGMPSIISNGLIPLIIIFGIILVIIFFVKKKYQPDKSELILFIFSFLMMSYTVLSIIGIWFRGPGMVLGWY